MSRIEPEYTELAVPGEDYLVSVARRQIWLLSQLTPEQFREYAEHSWGTRLDKSFQVRLSEEWVSRAAIPLIDNIHGLLAGVRLDHPNLQGDGQLVSWRSQGVSLKMEMDDEDSLTFTTESLPKRLTIDESRLDIFTTNIFEEAEHATTAQLDLRPRSKATLPIPGLVEGVPSVFVRLSTDRQRFIESTISPVRNNMRQAIEEILTQHNF